MTLKQYKDYFKENFKWTESISIGKIDNNKEKAICFYDKRTQPYVGIIGGNRNKSTTIKPITILLRYTKNQNDAEIMAQKYMISLMRSHFLLKKKEYLFKCYMKILLVWELMITMYMNIQLNLIRTKKGE